MRGDGVQRLNDELRPLRDGQPPGLRSLDPRQQGRVYSFMRLETCGITRRVQPAKGAYLVRVMLPQSEGEQINSALHVGYDHSRRTPLREQADDSNELPKMLMLLANGVQDGLPV
jgi:hypothetical protein